MEIANRNKIEMPFKKGYKKGEKTGGIKKGQEQNKTIIKKTLGLNGIEDLKQKTLENFNDFLADKNPNYRIIATKETAKYLFSTKTDAHITGDINVNFVNIKPNGSNNKLPEDESEPDSTAFADSE